MLEGKLEAKESICLDKHVMIRSLLPGENNFLDICGEFKVQIFSSESYGNLAKQFRSAINEFLDEELDDYLTVKELENHKGDRILDFFDELMESDDFVDYMYGSDYIKINPDPKTMRMELQESSFDDDDDENVILLEVTFNLDMLPIIKHFNKFKKEMKSYTEES